MSTEYRYKKQVKKEHTSPNQGTYVHRLTNPVSLAHEPMFAGHRTYVLRKALLLAVLILAGITGAWAQTDYSGVYYIGSVNYNAATPESNYYLCPTEGWCYYQATDDFTGTDNDMPFLTTYKCRSAAYHSGNPNDAIWIIEKAPAPNSSYYYIRQASTGKYLTSNGTIRTTGNADRMRIHLEAVAPENLDDKELFTIAEYSTYLTISPKGVVGGAAGRNWLTVNGGNKDSLKGASGKTGGPTGYTNTAGIIGIYTQDDVNAPFYLEKALSIDAPTITNNYDGTISITEASGATIYYTTDGSTPTMSSSVYSTAITLTDDITVIKAIAKATSDPFPTNVTTYYLPVCERPVISVSGSTVTITCTTVGATIHYTTDGSPATSTSTVYTGPFAKGAASTFRAIATKTGYVTSSEAILLPPTEVSSSSQITNMNGSYILASNFTSSGSIGTADNPFKGIINGNLNTLTLGGYPLVAYADGATIKNVILDNVSISSGNENGNAGAICCEATGDTRIYNCGVLSGSVGGSDKVGGIVGLLDGRARVINCYNYADITSGSDCGGIVGYNNVASTSNNLQTMVMNCMFYGSVTGGNAAPIYGGEIIHNKYASADDTGLNNYCYFLYDEEKVPYVKTIANDKYQGALGAEERFLNRFEFFRMTLNSTRNLAAFYVTGDVTQKEEMAKWVLDKSIAPYPILKEQDTYPSIVNPDYAHATTQTERNKGGLLGTLSVTISGPGSGAVFSAPTGASITTGSLTLNITDKDYDNFNYNYKKVQLPYYSEVGTGNYTGGRVVTGWKITSFTGGTPGNFTTDTYDYPSFNFVDRKCTNKDLYGTDGSNRVFAQGAYWEVPDGVTAITIEPYWAKAVYLSDANYDVTYTLSISGSTATANKYGVTVCGSCPTTLNDQTVYTDITSATNNLASNASHTVYDYAVVLVGNYHQAGQNAIVNIGAPVTFMSADLDGDNEPDNTLFYYHNQRKRVSEIRFDFLNIPGIGMVKRTHDATTAPEPGIFKPQGWFEITNTALIHCGQFEYAAGGSGLDKTILAPLILLGGVYEQFVSGMDAAAKNTNYILIGSNAWFKNFANGCHTKNAQKTPKVPINVAGGDYTNFYLTGIYQPAAAQDAENAECYIDGGRFSEVAGSGMQQVNGNVTWLINAADITSFFGGGINAAKPVTGSISTTISNSYVNEFYGGPKFGDMSNEKTVTTNATDCHFGKFFGAGYGGTAYNRVGHVDSNSESNTRDWDGYVNEYYKRAYSASNGGISTNYEYEFIPHSDGKQTVARFFVNYASLSLASTRDVTSILNGCTIGTFYGGGSLGAVNGNVNSTLTNCTVTGNAFGAGFSASVPTVEVWNTGAYLDPNPTYNRTANVYNNASVKTPKDNNQYTVYTWSNTYGDNAHPFTDTEDGKHYIHTDQSLDGLGSVTGNVTLIINGTTTVGESIYGGGEESGVGGDTHVTVNGGSVGVGSTGKFGYRWGNVYGGGKGKIKIKEDGSSELVVSSVADLDAGLVRGNTNIEINGTPTTTKILHNVYGGGAVGSVGTFTRDASGMPTACAANTGLATVAIKGGKIGHDHVDTGMVDGSSRGWEGDPEGEGAFSFLNQLAWINNSNVVIGDPESDEEDPGPSIWGSVYGGGENGHNFENGRVTVNKGTVGDREGTWDCGNVYGAGCGTDTFWRDKNGDGEVDEDETKNYNPMAGLVRGSTYVTINGGHVLRNVYGAGSMGSVGIYTIKAKHDDLTDGFGLSWPYEFEYDTYIDSQDGNTEKTSGKTTVTINGGRIGTNGDEGHGYVYGAAKGTVEVGESDIDKQRYVEALLANVRETEVIVNYPSTPPSGDLVTIDPSTSATIINDNDIPCITGAVFGGGEDGHVYEDAKIDIKNGLIGNSVYGGGRGKSTYRGKLKPLGEGEDYDTDISSWIAGKVYGNVEIKMTGGHVVRNIYGGGNLGSVGKGNYAGGADDYYPAGYGETLEGNLWETDATEESPDDAYHFLHSGKISVKVQAGTVGMDNGVQDGMPVGCIFGSSRGRAAADVGNKTPRYHYAPDFYLGYANETIVEIGKSGETTGPTIWGSVYGGGRDGHVRRHTKVTVYGGTIGKECTASTTITPGDIQWTERGNVFGSGSGMGMYDSNGDGTPDKHGTSSGSVTGWTQVFIKGGTIYQNIYGGGALSSVGAPKLNQDSEEYRKGDEAEGHGIGKQSICEVNIEGGTIGTTAGFAKSYGGYVFGAGRGGGLVSGELPENFATSVWTEVNVKPDHNPLVCGSVFGGGEQGLVKCGVDVNITGGEIENDVYGGGAKAHTNTSNWDATNDTWADAAKSTKYTTEVQLKGGKVDRNVYGGALGQTADAGKGLEDIAAIVYGDVLVELNNDEYVADSDKGCILLGSIFGCNNLNGTPMGDVKVHIYKTQNKDASRITNAPASGETPAVEDAKVLGRYDVPAVYGGGNQSAYEPADQTNNKTEVIIDGCAKTSIEQVYGGGNASSTPATNVTVNGTFEIEELFGGGNGKDNILINGVEMPNPGANVGYKDYSEYYYEDDTWKVRDKADADTKAKRMASDYVYGTGKASVNIYGGTVHRVFGGSNTKGNVRHTAVTLLEELEGEDCCPFHVDEAYGGGKSAEMDAEAQLLMACIPGLRAVYGGAEAADVRGNVTLNITNGTFDRVFGGNNLSGTIGGSITVNVEEIGCKPVKIGELYGGGNLAGYSVYGYDSDGTPKESGLKLYEDPQVNVMSFTSIGNVYGGGYGNTAVMVGNPKVNVNVAYGRYYDNVISNVPENTKLHDTYPIPSHAVGKMGAIYNVFGGGNAAKVIGNTTVNIATLEEVYVVKQEQVTIGQPLPEGCYTRSGAGTALDPFVYTSAEGTALDGVTYYEKKDVLGADIRNNVYGGGNNAEVTGNANVNIGKREDD